MSRVSFSLEKHKEVDTSFINRFCHAIWLLIIIAWFPIILSFYPGNLSPDSYVSISQALSTITSTAHPVLFTLLVKVCIQPVYFLTNDMNVAIATFSIIQMLYMAAIFAYTVGWQYQRNVPNWVCTLVMLYYAFNPLIARYAITMWKDIPFNGVLLLVILTLYEMITEEYSSKRMLKLLILGVLAAFLRNRVIYLVAGVYAIVLLIHRREAKKWIIPYVATMIATLLIQGPCYQMLSIKPSNFIEAQGVTFQQIARTIVEDGDISEKEYAFIREILPVDQIKESYHEHSVDYLKGRKAFNNDFLNTHKAEYMKVWFSIFRKNISTCLLAWVKQTEGFWRTGIWIEPYAITSPSEKYGIYQTNFIKQWTGIDLAYISNGILVRIGEVPIIRRLFDLGFLAWFVVAYALWQLIHRRWKNLIPVLPLLMLWITLLLTTPVHYEVRYMFGFHLALPIVAINWMMGDRMKLQGVSGK